MQGMYVYDTVYFLAAAIDSMLDMGLDLRNGSSLLQALDSAHRRVPHSTHKYPSKRTAGPQEHEYRRSVGPAVARPTDGRPRVAVRTQQHCL